MTEVEWLAGNDPVVLLGSLGGQVSDRKRRLFSCACCRRIWHLLSDERSRKAVEVAERLADGQASDTEVTGARDLAWVARAEVQDKWQAPYAAEAAIGDDPVRTAPLAAAAAAAALAGERNFSGKGRAADRAVQIGLLRCIVGNPFRPPTIDPTWLRWNGGMVIGMAQAVYQERWFADLPILGDMLEDAGCDDLDILAHCRQGGEHARGCWVVDLILARG
jgi:hypothetical protein